MARRPDPLVLALTRRRHAKGITQKQMAVLMGYSRNTAGQISDWERGKHAPDLAAVRRWADALGCDLTLTAREAVDG